MRCLVRLKRQAICWCHSAMRLDCICTALLRSRACSSMPLSSMNIPQHTMTWQHQGCMGNMSFFIYTCIYTYTYIILYCTVFYCITLYASKPQRGSIRRSHTCWQHQSACDYDHRTAALLGCLDISPCCTGYTELGKLPSISRGFEICILHRFEHGNL